MRDGKGDPPTLLICAGVPKAGTSWLYKYLKFHPDCYLRQIKELNYFNTLEPQVWEDRIKLRQGQREDAKTQLAACKWRDRSKRRWLKERIRDLEDWTEIDPRQADHGSFMEFLCKGRKAQRLVADLTPEYMMLEVEDLRGILRAAPDVRFLLLLRDPVDRVWSHIRMRTSRSNKPDAAFDKVIHAFLNKFVNDRIPGMKKRSDYATVLRNLTEVAGPERLHVTFFEQLFHPATGQATLRDLTDFLGIAPHPGDLGEVAYKGPEFPLGPDERRLLFTVLQPQYDFCYDWFKGELPERWHDTMAMEAA